MKLLVTGGYFDSSGECFVDRVDLASKRRERLLSFTPPVPHCQPAKGFTGAAWLGDDDFLVCAFDAVWRFEPSSGRCKGRLHQPDFNDLHGVHADHAAGQIHVCNTGLDAIETFDLEGRFQGRAAMTPAWFEAARQQGSAVARDELDHVLTAGWQPTPTPRLTVANGPYYAQASAQHAFHTSKVRDYAHPNHVVRWGHELVATLLGCKQVRSMHNHRPIVQIAAPPHDGVLFGDALWLTTVDGRVWRVDPRGNVDLALDTACTGHLGWCRGLAVSDSAVAIGLTAIRATPQHTWRNEPFERTETSVLWVERGTGRLLGRVAYGEPERHPKVFALLSGRGAWA